MDPNPAITLSRSLGSGGTEIGFLAARILGWRFCDRRLLRRAAEAIGRSVQDIAWLEEHPQGFWDHLQAVFAMGTCEAPYAPLPEVPLYSKDLFQVERRLMEGMLRQSPCVIVGRGGFVALRNRPATLHASIHAPVDVRAAALVAQGKFPDGDAARRAIEASDRNRAAFIREVSGLDWRDPANFHLVLDVSDGDIDAWANRLVAAFREVFPGALTA